MDLGLIGNCQFSALIDAEGGVAWLCWPRFDSSFIFGSLLGKDTGGCFQITPGESCLGRQNYLVNTNILRTEFTTAQGSFEVLDFAPRFYRDSQIYKPKMLIRIVRPLQGEPRIQVRCQPVYDYGTKAYQQLCSSPSLRYKGEQVDLYLMSSAPLTFIQEGRAFILDQSHYFILSYGEELPSAAVSSLCESYLSLTKTYWQTWVKHCFLPRDYQKEVIRSALVLKLHQYEDTGAIIASSTTSLPEAHFSGRTWDYRYCWLRDAWFSLAALQRLTQFEEMEKFVSYLRNLVAEMRSSGEVLQPVYGIAGERQIHEKILAHLTGYKGNQPVRVGNQAYEQIQHDVYGEMILAISPLFLDKRLLVDHVVPPRSLLESLLSKIAANLEGKDAGIWEFRGRVQLHTFTLLLHWAGAAAAYEIAKTCDYKDLGLLAASLVAKSSALIDSQCWCSERGAFVQAAGNSHLDASLLMMVNLGYLKPDDPRALSHVNHLAEHLQAGQGLLHRYRESDDFGETANAFFICSFWLAEAYGRLGQLEKGRALLEKLLSYSTPLGLYSEDMDPKDLSQWGNFPQTYSHVGLINAAFVLSRPSALVLWP